MYGRERITFFWMRTDIPLLLQEYRLIISCLLYTSSYPCTWRESGQRHQNPCLSHVTFSLLYKCQISWLYSAIVLSEAVSYTHLVSGYWYFERKDSRRQSGSRRFGWSAAGSSCLKGSLSFKRHEDSRVRYWYKGKICIRLFRWCRKYHYLYGDSWQWYLSLIHISSSACSSSSTTIRKWVRTSRLSW